MVMKFSFVCVVVKTVAAQFLCALPAKNTQSTTRAVFHVRHALLDP